VVGALPACCVGDEEAAKNGTDDNEAADDFKSPASNDDDHIAVECFELGVMATNAATAGRRKKLPPMLDALIFDSLQHPMSITLQRHTRVPAAKSCNFCWDDCTTNKGVQH
jgi:hypothetical protein